MTISAYINDELEKTLAEYGISKSDYKPAYSGESIGLDLFNAGPEITIPWEFGQDKDIPIPKILIPTGLHLCLPQGYGGFLFERGSIIKTPLKLRAGVIDPGYTDQIYVNLASLPIDSFAENHLVIPANSKLPVQLVILQTLTHTLAPVDLETYKHHCEVAKSTRRDGKIGSSDK